MMRFISGLVIGGAGGGIAYAVADSTTTAIIVAAVLACLIWFGLELVFDLFT